MKPYLVEIKNPETHSSVIVDMEGHYHSKKTRIGEHMYGTTLYIGSVPYHFEKYIPTEEELVKFQEDNEGEPQFSEGKFFYRLVPFTK